MLSKASLELPLGAPRGLLEAPRDPSELLIRASQGPLGAPRGPWRPPGTPQGPTRPSSNPKAILFGTYLFGAVKN